MTRRASHSAVIDHVVAATEDLRKAGHIPSRTGPRVWCWSCPSEGHVSIDGTRTGEIFARGCKE